MEVAVAVAVLAYSGTTLTKPEIAKICQFSENNFVGAQSGIMDPFTSCCGVDNHALLIDLRSLDYEALPLPSEVLLVICNSMAASIPWPAEGNTTNGVPRFRRE